MDILDLTEGLKRLQFNGVCLNVEERLQLEIGIQKLLNDSEPTDYDEL
jgi:hypothetical protein